MFDLLLRNALVVDGTGAPARHADVAVRGDRIAAVGDLSAASAVRTVDGTGCHLCPGFIDAHAHSDAYLILEPSADSKVWQGITTEIVGNCGASAAPLYGDYRMPSDWRDKTYPRAWTTVADYRALLEERKPAPNVVLLIGHNTLRAGVMGYDARPATEDELRRMEQRLEQALDEGGRGFSTGLAYAPGIYAPPEEVQRLARVAARRGGIYASHMRSEGDGLCEAIEETLAVGRATGMRVQISHLKTMGRPNWGKLDRAFDLVERAQARGLAVCADRYPYTAANTELDAIFPAWAAGGGRAAVLARIREPAARARLREDLLRDADAPTWPGIRIGSTRHPDNARYRGQALPDVARALGLEPVDAILHLCETDELTTGAFFFWMSEANQWRILAKPWVLFGSDASLRVPRGQLGADYPHPRAYGSLPRYLRAALDGHTVRFEDAVRNATAQTAGHFGLADRGIIAPGAFADLALLRLEALRDVADYANPHALAEGVELVAVNGVVTLDAGILTGLRAGRML